LVAPKAVKNIRSFIRNCCSCSQIPDREQSLGMAYGSARVKVEPDTLLFRCAPLAGLPRSPRHIAPIVVAVVFSSNCLLNSLGARQPCAM